jgi:glycosyltransferase involved in cell wall biosynthesis
MKILQVIPFFGSSHGGSAKSAYDISKQLSKKGHEVVMFTSDYKLDHKWIKNLSHVKILSFKTRFSLANFFVTPGLVKRAKKEVKNFDIIYLHNYRSFQNIIVAYYALKYNVPYVLEAHGSLPVMMGNQKFKRLFDLCFGLKILRGSSKLIAQNQFEVKQYANLGLPLEKIEVVLNGIDRTEYLRLPPHGRFRLKFGISDEHKLILYLGRIHKIKGIDSLVKAFAALVKHFSSVRLAIVGPDDGYLSELKTLIRNLGIENKVLIIGPLYDQEKLEAYVDADVYVLPSRYEIFGMTVLESVACGTAVILTENCGLAASLRDKVGLIVKSNSPLHLEEALFEMLTNQKRRGIFRENCKKVIEQFSVSEKVSKLEKVFTNVSTIYN